MSARAGVVCLALALASIAGTAAAQPSGNVVAEESKRAIDLYTEGRDLLTAGKPAAALPKLGESLRLMPSPNTELLIAHARREMGQKADAMDTYQRVQQNAENEVARDQDRYQGTAEEAKRWIATLGRELGTVMVSAPEGARIEVMRAGGPAVFTGTGRAYADPGEVIVTATIDGRTEKKTARVGAGTTARVDFARSPAGAGGPGGPGPEPGSPQPSREDDGAVISVPGIVLIGVGLVGVGLFAGFGVSAQSTLDSLEECSPSCPASRRSEVDAGERDQLIANVSIGVGAVAIAAGVTTWIVQAAVAGGDEPPPAAALWLGVPGAGPETAGLTFSQSF